MAASENSSLILGYQLGEKPQVRSVRIYDCTLREGEQTPGFGTFTFEQKLRFVQQLGKLGVDLMEVGTPAQSAGAKEIVRRLIETEYGDRMVVVSRTTPRSDLEDCIEIGVKHVHLGTFTSEVMLRRDEKRTRPEILQGAHDAVKLLKQHGIQVNFSLSDATRADLAFLIELGSAVREAGADYLVLADSMGCSNPWAMREQTARLIDAVGLPVDIHAHNDHGLAAANALAAVMGGATQVEVVFNSLGARNGVAGLPEVVMGLQMLLGVQTNIRTEHIVETAKLLESLSGLPIPISAPIVGANAFTHRMGQGHYRVASVPPDTLEHGLYEPAAVGAERRVLAS